MKLYMAVTADKYELPLAVGSARDIAQYGGVSVSTVQTSVCRKYSGLQNGYKYVVVDLRKNEGEDPLEQMYTTQEVSKKLKVSRQMISKLVKEGKLKADIVGKRYRFTEEYIEEYLKKSPE